MQTLRQSNTEAFLYGFTHLFGGNITQLIEPNLRVLDDLQQGFDKKNEEIRLEIEKQYQQLEKKIKQVKQAEKQ